MLDLNKKNKTKHCNLLSA